MAERRMFAKTIIDSDAFLDMPHSTQLLYFHLSMRADDDGFINNPKNIMRMIGCKDDDLKILLTKKFLLPFESGVVVIKHWQIHNYIQKDRYRETKYKEEKAMLQLDENKAYTMKNEGCIQSVYNLDTQDRDRIEIGKDSIELDNNIPASEEKSSPASVKANKKHKYGEYKNVLLKDEELQNLKDSYENWEELITYLDEYIEMKGYKANSHYLCIKKWVVDAVNKKQNTKVVKNGINDFKELWEEAKLKDEQSGNNTSNNSFGW